MLSGPFQPDGRWSTLAGVTVLSAPARRPRTANCCECRQPDCSQAAALRPRPPKASGAYKEDIGSETMDDVTRRSLLQGTGVVVAAAGLVQEAQAQARTTPFGPTDPYDLIIRGGEVVDPSQNLRGSATSASASDDRRGRTRDPAGARHPDARRLGPARPARPRRFPRPCPAGRRHRPVGRRAGALHRHHDLCERGRRRRRQLLGLQAFRHRQLAHPHLRLPAHLLDRASGFRWARC